VETKELEDRVKHGLSGFFRDSRGQFSIFTVVALLGSLALIYTCVVEAHHAYQVQDAVIYALFIMYCVNSMSDSLLGAVIARGFWKTPPAPETQITADVKTDQLTVGGDEPPAPKAE
jgi:hypothetical protein